MGFAVTNRECLGEQLYKCFWVCVHACVRAQMQVFLWGRYLKIERLGRQQAHYIFFFTDTTKLPSKKGCVVTFPGLDAIR